MTSTAVPVVQINVDPSASIDIFVPPSLYPPGSQPGDLIQINRYSSSNNTLSHHYKNRLKPLLFRIDSPSPLPPTTPSSPANVTSELPSTALPQATASAPPRRLKPPSVTVHPSVVQAFPWIKSRSEVSLSLILSPPPQAIAANLIELYFSAVYLGRPDQFRLSLSLIQKVVFLNQRVSLAGNSGTRLRVGGIFTNSRNGGGKKVVTALVDEDTKVVFRSESARCFIFIEVSEETSHFEEDGSMLREKSEVFLTELFSQFYDRQPATSHTVSVILFGRVIYEDNGEGEEERAPMLKSDNGMLYRDFYKVLLDLTPSPPRSIARLVAASLRKWDEEVLLRSNTASGQILLSGRLAYAHESPILEVTNLALNSFEEHWIDRDLQRTGLALLVVTAGTSFYHVDKKLLRVTTERMLFHGIGLDIISLSKAPLHTVPLFAFWSHEPGLAEEGAGVFRSASTTVLGDSQNTSEKNRNFPLPPQPLSPRSPLSTQNQPPQRFPFDQSDPLYYDLPPSNNSTLTPQLEQSLYYFEPHFIFCSFFGFQIDKPYRIDRFMPRARCYELFSQGIAQRIPIAISFLGPGFTSGGGGNAIAGEKVDVGGDGGHDDDDGEDGDDNNWSFLSEQEKKQVKRDLYDAIAVGAKKKDLRNGTAIGTTGGRTVGSSNSMGGTSVDSSDELGVKGVPAMAVPKIVKKKKTEGGLRISTTTTPIPTPLAGRSRSSSVILPSTSTMVQQRERERGRERVMSDAPRPKQTSSSNQRSKTPIARKRSPSVGSIRTVSSRFTGAAGRGTPSLISRLIPSQSVSTASSGSGNVGNSNAAQGGSQKEVVPSTATNAVPVTNKRSHGGWLGLFRHSSNSTGGGSGGNVPATVTHSTTGGAITSAPSSQPVAPSVAVQRVDAFSIAKPKLSRAETEDGSTIRSRQSSSTTSTSASSPTSTRRSSSTVTSTFPSYHNNSNSSHLPPFSPDHLPTIPSSQSILSPARPTQPTQPISISTRTAQTREADRPTKLLASNLTSSSYIDVDVFSSKKFAPVLGFGGIKANLGGGLASPLGKSSMRNVKSSTASRFNPSKTGKTSVGLADQARRWASIFIRHTNDQRAVNWVSVTRGACLPITTDYLPTAEALATQYSDYRYSIPTSSASSSFLLRVDNPGRSEVLELVTELISQRLAQGFQICTPANALGALDEINLATSKTITDVLREVDAGEVTAVYLSLSNQIHRISYERRTQSVLVKILQRKSTWRKEEYNYGALIWTHGAKNYAHTRLTFPYPSLINPTEWLHLDRLVAGIEKPDLRPSLRFWRTRLVLLPAAFIPDRDYLVSKTTAFEGEEVTDDDINAQGFLTLMSTLQSLRWTAPGQERESTEVYTTTLSAPEWAAERATKVPAQSQDAATANGAQQRSAGWLQRMTTSPTPQTPSLPSIPSRTRTPSPNRATETPLPPKRPTVAMTYSVVLDLDLQKRSERAERILCHFDRSHNSRAAYHIELTWLAGSGKIIDNTIQSWTRAVGRWGLNLIEVSTRPIDSSHNPFQKTTQIKLALPPPKIDESLGVHKHYYEYGLLQSLGFFLDIGADDTFPANVDVRYSYRRVSSERSQYIHRSGALLVCILGGASGFEFAPNRIFISHSGVQPDEIIKLLMETCRDEARLELLWEKLTSVLDRPVVPA